MLCALAVLLVPTDAEVFAVPLFAFWWSTFLALLPLLWRHGEHPHTILRCLMVAVGGLSSPLIIALTVLYAIRFLYFKSRTDALILVSAMAIACIQITTIIHSAGNLALSGSLELSKEIFYLTITKFFGYYLYFDHPRILALPLGIFIILLIGASIIYYRKHLLFGDWMVLACLLLAILASIVRAPLSLINPVNAGPRYFFFPFVLLSWTLLQLTARVDSSLSVLFVLVLLLSLRQTALVGQRFHDRLDWKSEVLACSHSEFYHLPIHTDGKLERLWHVRLTGTECRQLLAQSLIKYAPE